MNWSNIGRVAAYSCTVILLLLLGNKAATSSFTHDEAYSWLHYVPMSVMEIISYAKPFPNNHILNTIGMKVFGGLFGPTEVPLRLLSILSFLIFSFSGFQLIKDGMNRPAALIAFPLLVFNPYLLDFFALARGYAPSVAFMTLGLWQFVKLVDTGQTRYAIGTQVAFCLSMLANFSVIPVYLAVMTTYTGLVLAKRVENKRSNLLVFGLGLITCFFALYEPLRKIITYDLINFAGQESLVKSTLGTLVISYAYEYIVRWTPYRVIIWTLLALVIMAGLLGIKTLLRSAEKRTGVVPVITGVTLLIIVMQNLFLQSGYPIGRFATYLYPLLILSVVYLISQIKWHVYLVPILSLGAMLHTALHWSTEYTRNWKDDRYTKTMVLKIDELVEHPVKVGIHWKSEPVYNYYKQAYHLDNLPVVDRTNYHPDDDFRIYRGDLEVATPNELILQFHDPDYMLVRRVTK